jgi:HlyD family secretion protein/epimerase transport system membrane fusion protein
MSRTQVVLVEPRQISRTLAASGRAPENAGPGPLMSSVKSPVWKGYAIILVFLVGFGLWAGFAPLAGGAVASGIITPSSSRRVVQHLEGGIIRDLRVRDGDVVKAGDPLIVLEPVQPQSAHDQLLADLRALDARKARLEAERTGAQSIVFPPALYESGNLVPVAVSQREIFEARRTAHAARRNVIEKRSEQLVSEIAGYESQIESVEKQLALIDEEVEGKQKLLEQGLIPKPEALRLRRAQSELSARRAEFVTAIAKTKQQIGEAGLQITSAEAARLDEVTGELDKIETDRADLMSRLRASQDVLSRTTIAAPVDGTVINMRFKTVGGVVQRGEPVLEIVPKDDSLIIEARVAPNEIHLVHPGQEAQIHLSAYSVRIMPRIKGVVRSASADRVTDPNGHQSYFLARVEIDRADLEKRGPGMTLVPGMSAEVVFVTEERTLLEYLITPIADVLRRGMREM